MRKLIVSTLALLAAVQTPLVPAMAQEHGAAAAASAEAAAVASPILVSILKAGPRTFVTPDGDTMTLALFNMAESGDGAPMMLDSRTGLLSPVAQTDQDGVLSDGKGGTSRLNDHGASIDVSRDGQALRATAAAIQNEDVAFPSGDRTVRGRMTHAVGPGPHPVVVMVHGAGVDSRDFAFYAHLAGHLAANGVSVLTYDKRGWGDATRGRYPLISDLTEDVEAAVRYLRGRADVQRDRVGLIGVSEGGWTAPLAASRGGGVAFMSLIAAPAFDTWEQELDETNDVMTAAGASEADKALAFAAMRAMYRAAAQGEEPTAEMADFARQIADKPWASRIDFSAGKSNLIEIRRGRYDPAPALRSLTMPIQLLYGSEDLIVPYRRNVPAWRDHLAAAGAQDVTVDVFAQSGHALLLQTAGATHDINAGKQFAPGVLSTLTGWVRSRAGLDPVGPTSTAALTRYEVANGSSAVDGTYLNENGRIALVRRFGSSLVVNDLLTGRSGLLAPEPGSASDFRLYPFDGPKASSESVRFLRDGRLVTADQFGRYESARIETRLEPVTFRSGDITLGGVVMLPDGPGPFPAVAFVHGSGATSRVAFDAWGRYFAAHGIASIGYDKRGVGQSQGDYRIAGSADLSDDLTAAVDVLRARSDIRQDAIGILGTSAGGWQSVEVAQRRNIRFIITSSMGPLRLAEQERYRRVEIVKAAGHDAATQELAGRVTDAYFRYLGSCGREGAAEISAMYATYGAEPWFKLLPQAPQDPTTGAWPPLRRSFGSDLGYQTLEAYAAYPGPMLFLLGGADPLVPTRALSERIAASGRPDWTQFMFDGADHGVAVPARNVTPRVAEGYYDRQIEWIQARLAEPVVWSLHEDRATSTFQHRCEGL